MLGIYINSSMSEEKGKKKMSVKKIIGSALREFRKNRKLSIEQMAKKTGFSYSSIANFETGDKLPSLEFQRVLSRVFKVDFLKIIQDLNIEEMTSEEISYLQDYIGRLEVEMKIEEERKKSMLDETLEIAIGKIMKTEGYKNLPRSEIDDLKEFIEVMVKERLKQITCKRYKA